MLILGIDTSGRQGSVALLRTPSQAEQHAAADPLHTLEVVSLEGGQYSELLVPAIAGLLERHGAKRSSVDLIALASGPGSFTGLRISVATAKGLSEAFATPVVSVSVLEAIAIAAQTQGRVLAALDAQRSEVFFGEYVVHFSAHAATAQMIREGIAPFDIFVSGLTVSAECEVFTPDDTIAARLTAAEIASRLLPRPDAEAYARIAYCKFSAGVRDDVATLDANYLRRSDAEIFSAPKLGIAHH